MQRFRIRRPLLRRQHAHETGAIGVLPLLARAEAALRQRRVQFADRSRTLGQRHGRRLLRTALARRFSSMRVSEKRSMSPVATVGAKARATARRRLRSAGSMPSSSVSRSTQQRQARGRRQLRDARDLRLASP